MHGSRQERSLPSAPSKIVPANHGIRLPPPPCPHFSPILYIPGYICHRLQLSYERSRRLPHGTGRMPAEYKTYVLDTDENIILRIDLFCDSDAHAKERAQQLVDESPVELWKGDDLLGRFEP